MNANQIESVAQVNNTKKRRQNQIMGVKSILKPLKRCICLRSSNHAKLSYVKMQSEGKFLIWTLSLIDVNICTIEGIL